MDWGPRIAAAAPEPSAPLPPVLDAEQVAARYGCSIDAARTVMHQAGAFRAARRLHVRVDALDAWEHDHTVRELPEPVPPSTSSRRRRRRAGVPDPNRLQPGWWRP